MLSKRHLGSTLDTPLVHLESTLGDDSDEEISSYAQQPSSPTPPHPHKPKLSNTDEAHDTKRQWLTMEQAGTLAKLLRSLIYRYRPYHQAIKKEARQWEKERDSFPILEQAIRNCLRGEIKRSPIGYIRKVVRLESAKKASRAVEAEHQERKEEEAASRQNDIRGGTVLQIGSQVDNILKNLGGKPDADKKAGS